MYTVNNIVQTSDLSILPKQDQICTAIDKNTGEICGETDSLQILDEFRKLYEARIQKVDSEPASEFDRVSMKCQIMIEWIKDLGEQNVMLVNTVKDLEQTASDKVKLLEDKLKQSSHIVSDRIVQSSQSEKALCALSHRISELQTSEECFSQRIEFLQEDVKGLLELIKRAQDNHWSLEGIQFHYISPRDIPTPIECACGQQEQVDNEQIQFLKQQIAELESNERKACVYRIKLEEENAELTEQLIAKEETIQTHVSEIQNLSDRLKQRSKLASQSNIESASVSTNSDINIILVTDTMEHKLIENLEDKNLQQHLQDTESKTIEVAHMQLQLEEKNKEIEELKHEMACLQKVQKRMNNHVTEIPEDAVPNAITIQQFKLLEEFRVCTVEVQAATEDIREEINIILSSFASQHEKYSELSKVVRNTQEQLIRMREAILQAIDKLESQEIEKIRYTKQILAEKVKLKDMKNQFIRAQTALFHYINSIQEKMKDNDLCECAEMYACNDLLNFVVDKVELIVNHVQILQNQECFFTSTLAELKEQLRYTMCTFQGLQKHMSSILLQGEVEETILCERERRLEKLEAEIDNAHTKMQDTLETFCNTGEQCDLKNHTEDCQSHNQTINELLKAKEDLCKLKKEYDDFKLKMLEKTCKSKNDDKINQWKCRAIELEDQLHILQHEIKIQKEVEAKLKKSLDSNEIELQKSKELLQSFHKEFSEELPRCCGYQFKHENTSQLINILQEAIQSTKTGLQDVECELKKLVCEESYHSCTSVNLIKMIIDKVRQYEGQLDKCYEDIGNLRNTLCSKDKLLENMNQVVMIQNDSIAVTQNELKSLYKKQQEKIDMQDLIITQYEKENKDLTKQNELQAQTIGHLQSAVVEAKRCLDSMGHKAVSDVSELWSSISSSTFGHGNVHDI